MPVSGNSVQEVPSGFSRKHRAALSSNPCIAITELCHLYRFTPLTKESLLCVILTGEFHPWSTSSTCLLQPTQSNVVPTTISKRRADSFMIPIGGRCVNYSGLFYQANKAHARRCQRNPWANCNFYPRSHLDSRPTRPH